MHMLLIDLLLALALVAMWGTGQATPTDLTCTGNMAECVDIKGTQGRATYWPGSTKMAFCVATPQAWALFDSGQKTMDQIPHICWELKSLTANAL